MKHLLRIFALTLTLSNITAQETYDLKSQHDLREFDEPSFENIKKEKHYPRVPALLKSSLVNSNPEFVSASSDSVYEDSTYLFNVLTNDPDGEEVSVSISSNPSWLSFSSKEGGIINDISKNYMTGNNVINGLNATDLVNLTPDAVNGLSWIEYDLEIFNGDIYFSADTYIGKIKTDGTVEVMAGQYNLWADQITENSKVDTTKFSDIKSFTHDSNGNLYVADVSNKKIFKIDSNGTITTFAGTGEYEDKGDDGLATSAGLHGVYDIIFDGSGNLYIVGICTIRKVDTNGIITRYGGTGGNGYTGDGGSATSASFWATETAFDASGNLFFSDATTGGGENVIRKIDTNGIITTFAGDGNSGYTGDGGLSTSAKLNRPRGLTFNSDGELYFSDSGNHAIRKIDVDGKISTIAGTGVAGFSGDGGLATVAKIDSPDDIVVDGSGNIIFFDVGNGKIRKISTEGIISTIAGTDIFNGDNILATEARINLPRNPAFDKHGNLFVAEQSGHRIRKIDTSGKVTTVAGNGTVGYSGDGSSATIAQINNPRAVAVDNYGNIYISDAGNNRIRKVDTNGIISTFAGTGVAGFSGDEGEAILAQIDFPYQISVDKNENIYFAEYNNSIIRKVDVNGIISTVAGDATSDIKSGYSGDGGAATSAKLKYPLGVAFDSEDNMYIGDYANNVIRKVDSNGIISTVAGTGTAGYSGDGGMATSAKLYKPTALTVDLSGNIYFCDTYNEVVRRISKNGIISTIAGTGTQGYSGNGGAAASAKLYRPYGIAVDSLNNIYITDSWNYVIRKIDASYHTLSGIPTNSDVGTTTMTLTASDGQGGSATQSFALKVINTNDAPVLASVTNVTTNEDTAKTVTLSGTDVDGDALIYTGKSNTDKVTVAISSAIMTLTPAADWYGTASITAYVSDGTVKDSTSFTLTVASISDVAAINTTTIEEDASATVTLSSTFSGTPTYSAKSDTSAITVSVSSTTLQLTPSSNWNGSSTITAYASVGTFKDSTTFTLNVTAVNDAPVITAVANASTNEETEKALVLKATDVDGDALTYSATSDTSAVAITISTDTLKLNPALNYTGTSVITVIVSDNALADTTKFDFKVINVNDIPVITALPDTTMEEDSTLVLTLNATDVDGDAITYTAVTDIETWSAGVSSSTFESIKTWHLVINPSTNWFGEANITVIASDEKGGNDSTAFSLMVTNVQDAPYAFDWVSTASDTIDITQDAANLAEVYKLEWTESKDVDGETIDYLLYAKIGVNPPEEIYDTTSTSVPITYQEFADNAFEPFPMLPRVTIQFSMEATDGIDTVKITGDNRVLFINRYEYLSTISEGIPTEFALHENYPNPFNPTTTLRFDLPELSDMTLTIYNMLGQKVRTFDYHNTSAGYHSVTWDATNDFGQQVGAGVYLYQLQAKDFVKTRKMVLLK